MTSDKREKRPDILLIVLDTLRADRLSGYGYGRSTSPNLDTYAKGGVLFERAISPAQWTIPSHASLFTGEYPTTHMTVQIYDKHTKDLPTLAEVLRDSGYDTAGFCCNPLLGVVENDLDRGFDDMFNYGGAFPTRPDIDQSRPRWVNRLLQRVARRLSKMTSSLQDVFARNNLLLRIALHPRLVPLWQQNVNFKGNTVQAVRDLHGFLRARRARGQERPLFAFANLMETHLPFRPPRRFKRRFAPYLQHDDAAREFLEAYNLQQYRWMVPLSEPLTATQDRVLNDLYDAEIAYEDRVLRRLLRYLSSPEVEDDTLVIITSDHGEGMNNHDFVGHSLVAYDDLVHVPLIVRYPRLYPAGERIRNPISTRRVFHSVLEAAGLVDHVHGREEAAGPAVNVEGLSLRGATVDEEAGAPDVMAEAYVPDTLIALMEHLDPQSIDRFRCRQDRRAIYAGEHKMIEVGGEPDELFHMLDDPGERRNLLQELPELATELDAALEELLDEARRRRPEDWEEERVSLEDNPELMDRLRGLGYVE